MCLYLASCVYLSTNLALSIRSSMSLCLSVYLLGYLALSINLSIHLAQSIHLSRSVYLALLVRPSIWPYLSIYLSCPIFFCLSIFLSICLSRSVYLFRSTQLSRFICLCTCLLLHTSGTSFCNLRRLFVFGCDCLCLLPWFLVCFFFFHCLVSRNILPLHPPSLFLPTATRPEPSGYNRVEQGCPYISKFYEQNPQGHRMSPSLLIESRSEQGSRRLL